MTLGLVIVAGVVSVFANSKQGYRAQESSGRIQESARYALDYIGHAIRQSDMWVGVPLNNITTGTLATASGSGSCDNTWIFDVTNGVHGYAGITGTGTGAPWDCISNYIASSDVLALRYANPDAWCSNAKLGSAKATGMPYGCNSAAPYGGKNWYRGQVNRLGYLFDITSTSALSAAQTAISGSETSGILNYQFAIQTFHLESTSYTGSSGSNTVPQLYSLQIDTSTGLLTSEPVVDGVEMMKFEYGLDSGSTGSPSYQVGLWTTPPPSHPATAGRRCWRCASTSSCAAIRSTTSPTRRATT